MSLDLGEVRAQFPALAGDTVFFDNAGGSQVPARVAQRVADYLLQTNVQLGASYARSVQSGERVAEANRSLARLVNASDPKEIVVGASTTQLLFNLAQSIGRTLRPGDRIVVTNADHAANIGPWRSLERAGIHVDVWKIDRSSLRLELDALGKLMGARTRLVCFTHVSNVLGTIHPAAAIARYVHERGAQVCIDGVAFAPHRRVDVQAIGADYYAISLYKVFGPHVAMLYARGDLLAKLPSINHDCVGEGDIPYKLQPGNLNFELAWGAAGAVEYLEALGSGGADPIGNAFEQIAVHEESLAARLLGYLDARRDTKILGEISADRARRVATISFVVAKRDSSSIPPFGDARGIGFRFGDFYSRDLIDALRLRGVNGVVRVSMAHYNTLEEVDRLIAVLDETL